ncbi:MULTISPECIES: DUF7511 domain-containing protein [Halorubrum]|uniref:DUF7511 domain-containing protein n=1 Tax=Halorubrum ezzemoulense TaxID=337243 RepID=A0A256IWA8_HALEZ|nr:MULTISPECIES: hypothetical protein [Halorubrum]MDV7350993.1 hypothetical protein [Halorubrum distributum]OYR60459.1 hypothetical protein DJ83_09860 [Halorubrum ezzemoulense]OYR60743.1 hypothetical protein DJ80_14740 [Halorubrum ezzemoulense]OYR66169.1 hypothetical protein DJ79_13365 [Halorubrum ezzemoulense]OYR69964.1 hypothetical protein DJ78_09990 [Halorubrum ezzemoulense]
MSDTTSGDTEPEWDGNAEPSPSKSPRSGLMALVVGPAERPVCTIYPPDVAVPYRTTTWITAYGNSFVDLDDYR